MLTSIRNFIQKFRRIRKIDEVSSMERLGRDEYKYIERDHELRVQVELQVGPPHRIIYSGTIKEWLPPHENDAITEEERKRILTKICKYFDINGLPYTVE